MTNRLSIKGIWEVIKLAAKNFGHYSIPKLSGSLAYYTVFSLGPLLVVLIAAGSLVMGHSEVQTKVYNALDVFMGKATADELLGVIQKASLEGKSGWAIVLGGATLLLAATGVFGDIQDSINRIWGIRARHKKGWLRVIKNRLLSFSIVVTLAFLLLVSLVLSTLIDSFGNRLRAYFPDAAVVIFYILNSIFTLAVITMIFALIFRLLPDTRTPWRDIWGGAIITGILFMLGKMIISLYISKANIGAIYGAAGAFVILLVWVYYSAMILYFGAAITRHWVVKYGEGIKPDEDAATTREVEVEKGHHYKER
jgi:membrane protein